MATYYRELPDNTTYRFDHPRSHDVSLRELRDTIWESVQYPGMSMELRQDLAVGDFLQALDNSKLSRDLGLLSPRTLDEAYEVACKESDWRSSCTFSHSDRMEITPSRKGSGAPLICYRCRVAGHVARNCPKKRKNRLRTKAIVCWRCHCPGHIARNCMEPAPFQRHPSSESSGRHNSSPVKESPFDLEQFAKVYLTPTVAPVKVDVGVQTSPDLASVSTQVPGPEDCVVCVDSSLLSDAESAVPSLVVEGEGSGTLSVQSEHSVPDQVCSSDTVVVAPHPTPTQVVSSKAGLSPVSPPAVDGTFPVVPVVMGSVLNTSPQSHSGGGTLSIPGSSVKIPRWFSGVWYL